MKALNLEIPDAALRALEDEAIRKGLSVNEFILDILGKRIRRKRLLKELYRERISFFMMSETLAGYWYEECEIFPESILKEAFAGRTDKAKIMRGICPIMLALGFKYKQIKRKGSHTRIWVRNTPLNLYDPIVKRILNL